MKKILYTALIVIAILLILLITYKLTPYNEKDVDRVLDIDLGNKKANLLDYWRLDINHDRAIDLYDGILILNKIKKNWGGKMTAKEMFEKLGYKQLGSFRPDDNYIVIAWDKEKYSDRFTIYFYNDKAVRVIMETKRGEIYPLIVELEELQAINKQVEELDWNEQQHKNNINNRTNKRNDIIRKKNRIRTIKVQQDSIRTL